MNFFNDRTGIIFSGIGLIIALLCLSPVASALLNMSNQLLNVIGLVFVLGIVYAMVRGLQFLDKKWKSLESKQSSD